MNKTISNIFSARTALYPITQKRVAELDRIISDKLMKWCMFSAKWELHAIDYYGKEINYKGIKYEGSPRKVFWSNFTEPFLENGIIDILNQTYRECQNRNLCPDKYLKEAAELLKTLNRKVFKKMSSIDQVLRGGGYPNSVKPQDVTKKIDETNQFIDAHLKTVTHKEDEISKKTYEDIIDVKPNFFGIGLNLNTFWRKFKKIHYHLLSRWFLLRNKNKTLKIPIPAASGRGIIEKPLGRRENPGD